MPLATSALPTPVARCRSCCRQRRRVPAATSGSRAMLFLRHCSVREYAMSVKVSIVPVTAFQQNCSVVKCEATGRAAIVDPGGDIERILAAVSQLDATVEKILLTHGHMDHCAASAELRAQLQVPIEGPEREDAFWIEKLPQWCEMTGLPHAEAFEPDRWLQQGDTVTIGAQTLKVFHCPGHTPGHVVFLYEEQRLAWVGDVAVPGLDRSHRLPARQSRGVDCINSTKTVSARRRYHLHSRPRPDLDLRSGTRHQSVCCRSALWLMWASETSKKVAGFPP